jgi:hypothetical protein
MDRLQTSDVSWCTSTRLTNSSLQRGHWNCRGRFGSIIASFAPCQHCERATIANTCS